MPVGSSSFDSSLMPPAQLQSRTKRFLQPCKELSALMSKQVAAWLAFEQDMKKYKDSDLVLDRDFYHQYPGGEKEKIKKVGEAISRVVNTINKPDANAGAQMN